MTMDGMRTTYRKLPGHRRGFLFGSSVWLGPDHLLLVKSSRFREEYRRFYFRDIQAIVWAAAPRFHVSTRSAAIGAAWGLFALETAIAAAWSPLRWIAGVSGFALVAVWAWLSGWASCRCRIYTAVSAEDLPSVYRVRTARRFLAAVEPHVMAAQGSMEAIPAQEIEERQIGPLPEGRVGLPAGPAAATEPASATAAAVRTPVAILFVASLCLGGVADLAALGARADVARWVLAGFLLLQMAAAVAVMIQSYTGRLRGSLRNLAIAAVAAIGVWYYAVQMGAGIAMGYRNEEAKRHGGRVEANVDPMAAFAYPASRGAAGGIGLLVGLAGLVLLARGERPSEEKVSFNV